MQQSSPHRCVKEGGEDKQRERPPPLSCKEKTGSSYTLCSGSTATCTEEEQKGTPTRTCITQPMRPRAVTEGFLAFGLWAQNNILLLSNNAGILGNRNKHP
ncbi:hypothetical protein AMECASPLE_018252 [Ameca splendens]|uniref:Uncharacterized protein n=1 Tax=Ameca splendens TaxID=208324 RepID=A0ABV0XRN8_9TELE